MNWKQFLKPTKWKIILFIIVFIILSFIPVWPAYVCPNTNLAKFANFAGMIPCSLEKSSFLNFLKSFMITYELVYYPDLIDLVFIYFVLPLIIAYIISCLIVRPYDKFSKKRNNT